MRIRVIHAKERGDGRVSISAMVVAGSTEIVGIEADAEEWFHASSRGKSDILREGLAEQAGDPMGVPFTEREIRAARVELGEGRVKSGAALLAALAIGFVAACCTMPESQPESLPVVRLVEIANSRWTPTLSEFGEFYEGLKAVSKEDARFAIPISVRMASSAIEDRGVAKKLAPVTIAAREFLSRYSAGEVFAEIDRQRMSVEDRDILKHRARVIFNE